MNTFGRVKAVCIAVSFTTLLMACGGGGSGGSSSRNTAPEANAGPDQTGIDINTEISLDGGASSDADGDPITFSWIIAAAPPTSTAVLSDATVSNPTFSPDVEGSYIFELIVNDGEVASSSDSVGIATSLSEPPVARFGSDSYNRITEVNVATELIAWDSVDQDDDTIHYEWTLTAAPYSSTATVGSINNDEVYVFTPDVVGTYTFSLSVNDGVLTAPVEEEVTVTALDSISSRVFNSGDTFPIAIPDNDITTGITSSIEVSGAPTSINYLRVLLNLDHTLSLDLDIYLESPTGTMLTLSVDNQYLFNSTLQPSTDLVFDNYLATGPVGSIPASAIFLADEVLTNFDGEDANGIWQLHVFDDNAGQLGSLVNWQLSFPYLPVIADAGTNQTVAAGTNIEVMLDGSTSVAQSGDPLTYTWNIEEAPANSTATLDDSTASMPTFIPDEGGEYVISLVVSDGLATSVQDVVTITAELPAAVIDGPGLVETGTMVTLDGSNSSTLSGGGILYSWRLAEQPAGSTAVLSSTTAVMPTFTPDIDGEYVVELIVDDGFAESEAVVKTMFAPGVSSIYTSTASFPIAITDRNLFTTPITVSGATNPISVVSVHLDITHTFDADLEIYLISPNGVRVMLTTDNGGSGNNFTNTEFNDFADISVTEGSAPFTGSYRPEEPLSILNDANANGTWLLEVFDDAGADQGTLNSWQLEIWE